ncbi:crosslink repair DNA glycosylase YcaQ family protein [Streptomyces sp. NPDC050738]|uniref:DNA glycosylase AlkZ-like family protein n=1 Tax=Streptomyces sp. NPDC050738 TaxID=3154744 RepID=UPI0034259C28
MAEKVTAERLRAWWAHRQGLDGSLRGAQPEEVLAATGWARSVGGSGPYLGLYARCGAGREAVDAAVAALAVHELPSARGCTYVLPAGDFALGLAVGAGAPEGDIKAAAKHLGVTAAEVDALCAAVVGALGETPMLPAAIRTALGDEVRALGEAGKKRGLSTTLPLALGRLQARGEIRRVPVNGRLDQQRYGYVRWGLDLGLLGAEEAQAELARRYFAWAAPASLAHFRWFSGFTAAVAKAAVAGLELVDVGGGLLLPGEWEEEFRAYVRPKKPRYALLAGIDGIHLLHRDLGRLLDAADGERTFLKRSLGGLADAPAHMIVDRGRLVGLWEYDVEAEEIVWQAFVEPDAALRKAVAETAAFVRDELGDARSFSLDSPKSRAPRVAELRVGMR